MSASERMILEEEFDELRLEIERLRAERDHFRDAWATVQVRLDCGIDVVEAIREQQSAIVTWLRANTCGCYDFASAIERGEHLKES